MGLVDARKYYSLYPANPLWIPNGMTNLAMWLLWLPLEKSLIQSGGIDRSARIRRIGHYSLHRSFSWPSIPSSVEGEGKFSGSVDLVVGTDDSASPYGLRSPRPVVRLLAPRIGLAFVGCDRSTVHVFIDC